MLSRMAIRQIEPRERILAVAILAASIAAAMWDAGRLYAAVVLMYGQKPGLRSTIAVLRAR